MARIIIGNERDNPDLPRWQVVDDFRRVKAFDPDFLLLNEIGEAEDHVDLAKVFPPSQYHHLFSDTPNPAVVKKGRRGWRVRNVRTNVWHKGMAGFTPRRLDNYFEVQRTTTPWRKWAGMSVGHLINRAWNGKEQNPQVEQRRQDIWEQEWRDWRDSTVLPAYRRHVSQLFGGDWNRKDVPKFHTNQQWIAGHADIVKLAVLRAPGGARIRMRSDEFVIPTRVLHTDHPYRGRDISITNL